MSKTPNKRSLLSIEEELHVSHRSPEEKKAFKRKKRDQNKKEELSRMILELEQAKKRIGELEEQLETTPFDRQIVKNTRTLIKSLPPKSPYRRPILFFLGQLVDRKQMMDYYDISESNYYLIMKGDGSTLVEQRYAIDVKRPRITEDQKEEIRRILDDILPFQSGRSYRCQEQTDDFIYQKYRENVKKGWPVSKSYLIYKILTKERIHHSKTPIFCPLCEKASKGNITKRVQNHLDILPFQRKKYLEDKKQIADGDTETILITQDFTQLDLESGFLQDLIICCYWYDSNSKDGLGREYKHFVGEKGDKNDIKFVAGAWKQLLQEGWFDKPSKILIWSDGGPKHFKISANLKLFQSFQRDFPDILWEYHFFPPYHGCNVCDAVAAHAKKKLNEDSRNFHEPINSSSKVVEKIGKLINHEATFALLPKEPISSITFTNITKYFKFTAPTDENVIYAYDNSYSEEPTCCWEVTERIDINSLQ
jgi:hypothetical protein